VTKFSNRTRATLALVTCAAVGAAGGIAGSAAAPSSSSSKAGARSSAAPAGAPARPRMPGAPPRRGPGHGPAVHSEEVVLNRAGTAFITATQDSGKVKSVSGRDVTIAEGIGSVTYKDVTITLPESAKIERNGKMATIDALKAGDRIHVTQSSDGVVVHAGDASFRPRPPKGGPGRPGPAPGAPPPAGP
jgi:hypothetical protein